MKETPSSANISTRLERIAKLAKDKPGVALTTLAHHIDLEWLREAYRRTREDAVEYEHMEVDVQVQTAESLNCEHRSALCIIDPGALRSGTLGHGSSREALFVLGCAQIGDGNAGIAEGHVLAHARIPPPFPTRAHSRPRTRAP